MSSELRVGLLFFVGLGTATWLTFNTGSHFGPKPDFLVHFRKAGQLKTGDKVTYNGVKVGIVATVDPVISTKTGEPLVKVGFTVEEKHRTAVLIGPETVWKIDQGTLGGANLEIASRKGQPIMAVGQPGLDPVIGEDTVAISDVVKSVNSTVEENRPEFKAMIHNFKEAGQRIAEMSEQIRDLVKVNRDQVALVLKNAATMTEQISGTVAENREQIKQAIAGINNVAQQLAKVVEENRDNIRLMMAKAPGTVDQIGGAANQIQDAIKENREDLRATMRKLAELAPKLDQIGTDLSVITKQISEGKGTLGKLVFDDEMHRKATEAITNLNQRLEEVKPLTAGISDLKFYAGIDGGMNVDSGVQRGYAYLRIEPRPWKFYEGGVSYRSSPTDRKATVDDPNKLNVDFNFLFGWRFFPDDRNEIYHLSVAGGLIDSQLGGRIDVPLFGESLMLRTIIRKKDNTRDEQDRRFEEGSALLRMTMEYKPFKKYGIFVSAGADDLLDHPGFFFGLRGELLDQDLRNLTTVSGLAR